MNSLLTAAYYALLAIAAAASASIPANEADATIRQAKVCTASPGEECTAPPPLITSVYVIGDLHGDVQCAIAWVNRTGLIDNLFRPDSNDDSSSSSHRRLNPASKWSWNHNNNHHNTQSASLVFMGDYIDKGPTSKQTVEFVRDLTLRFPNRVAALIGNHELELLRDRDARISPEGRYGSYSYASVHPGEYHNYFDGGRDEGGDSTTAAAAAETTTDETTTTTNNKSRRSLDANDEIVLNLLYEASMEVYSHGAHNAVRFVPTVPASSNGRRAVYAITDIIPPEYRILAKVRLEEYQDAYLNAYRSDSVLGRWLESRPIIHFAENINTLFVHGGVHPNIGKTYLNKGKESVDKLNSVWREHSTEEKLFDFLSGSSSSEEGQVVYSLLTHRGNHPGYSKWESHGHVDDDPKDKDAVCVELEDMLADMPGVDRIAVGHTPDFHVRFYCDQTFLALDSMLGRGIREIGNEYCPWHGHDMKGTPKVSRNGKYKCDDIPGSCSGEIVRLDSDGSIHILKL